MGTWNFKKFLLISSFILIVLFFFGQNFDLVPKNYLLSPPREDSLFLQSIHAVPSNIESFNPFKKYLWSKPPALSAGDMTFGKIGEKALNKGLENYYNDNQFQNSEMGRMLKDIEKKSQTKLTLLGSRGHNEETATGGTGGGTSTVITRGSTEPGNAEPGRVEVDDLSTSDELALYANSNRAYFSLKSSSIQTTCGYTINSQAIDVQFKTSRMPAQSFGVDLNPITNSGTLKMQMNW